MSLITTLQRILNWTINLRGIVFFWVIILYELKRCFLISDDHVKRFYFTILMLYAIYFVDFIPLETALVHQLFIDLFKFLSPCLCNAESADLVKPAQIIYKVWYYYCTSYIMFGLCHYYIMFLYDIVICSD